MASFMAKHCKLCRWVCKICGIWFIHDNDSNGETDTIIPWKSFYTAYCACCMALVLFGAALYYCYTPVSVLSEVQAYTQYLYIVFYSLAGLRMILNICAFVKTSNSLLEFFKKSARYESRVRFKVKRRWMGNASRLALRCFLFAAFSMNLWTGCHVSFGFLERYKYSDISNWLFRAAFVFENFLYCSYDVANFLLLRPCTEVLALYIRHQQRFLQSIIRSSDSNSSRQLKKLRHIGVNLWSIKRLRDKLNKMWQYTLMVSVGLALCTACIGIYTAFDQEVPMSERGLAAFYAISLAIDVVEIARLSQAMGDELRKTRRTLYKARICFETEVYYNQVCSLCDAINPKEMLFTAGGFFYLDLPLVVSLTGSVITHSVVLVQTRDRVTSA